MSYRTRVVCLFLVLGAIFASPLFAADIVWKGADLGDWGTTTNWDTGVLPAGTNTYINNNTTAVLTLSGTLNPSIAALYLGRDKTGTTNGAGGLNMSGAGTLSASGSVVCGYTAGRTGTLDLSSGTLSGSGAIYVGYNGSGIYRQSGGTASFGSTLRAGYYSGSSADITFSGSAIFNTSANVALGYAGGTAELTQTSGTINCENIYYVGYTGTGTNIQSGGDVYVNSVAASDTPGGGYYVGYAGSAIGVCEQTNGNVYLGSNASYHRDFVIGGYQTAEGPGTYGYYKLSGGSLNARYKNNGFVGHYSYGVMEQTDGTFDVGSIFWVGGHYSTSTTNCANAFGVYNLSGGTAASQTYDTTTKSGIGGGGGTGVFNLSGTGSFTCNSKDNGDMFAVGGYSNADTAILNLGAIGAGGGTFSSKTALRRYNLATTGTSLINFHGATLRALNNGVEGSTGPMGAESFLNGTTTYVYAEGAKIDTNGCDVTIDNALLSPSAGKGVSGTFNVAGGAGYKAPPVVKITGGGGVGATAIATINSSGNVDQIILTNPGTGYTEAPTVTLDSPAGLYTTQATATAELNGGNDLSGGLTKQGAGTLTLSGMSTYQGPTKVEAGTLKLTGSLESSLVEVQANATLMGTGSLLAGGDVSVAATGFLKPGSSIGTLTVTGDATIGGTLDVEYNSTTEEIDMLAVSGELDLTGATINFTDLEPETLDQTAYVFATYGTLVGAPAIEIGVPENHRVDYAYKGNSIALVPEPGMLVLLGLAALGLLGLRSRK